MPFGRIAQATLPLAKAFGMRVIVWTLNPSAERAGRHSIEFCDLDDILAESDVLSLNMLFMPNSNTISSKPSLKEKRSTCTIRLRCLPRAATSSDWTTAYRSVARADADT